MSEKDSTLQDIKSGKGLAPLNPQSPSNASGLTTEQREGDRGLKREQYSLNRRDGSKGKNNA